MKLLLCGPLGALERVTRVSAKCEISPGEGGPILRTIFCTEAMAIIKAWMNRMKSNPKKHEGQKR